MDHERNQEEMTDANGQTEVHTRPDENTMEIRQTRTLSSKMQEEYEKEVAKHVNKLTKINGLIEEVIAAYGQSDNPTEELLIKMRDDLQKYLEKFERRVNEFFQYLERTKTSESSIDLAAQKVSAAAVIQKTRTCQANINASLQSKTEIDKKSITSNKEVKTEKAISKRSKENSETKSDKKFVVAKQEVKTDKAVSVHSRVKSKSNRSSSSLAKQRMKTEAARCKLEFAEMEAKLKLEKIRIEEEETRLSNQKKELEVNMDLLTVQRAVKEAEIEYDVMLEEMSDDNSSHGSNKSSVASKDVYERTKDYVSQQNDMYPLQQSMPYQMTEIPSNKHYTEQHFQTDSKQPQTSVVASNNDSASIASEMAKLIMKKDILMSRLTLFTDKVEHYLIWKTKFRSIMRDLNVTPQEELDLLVRWLGPESSRHALGLQAANAHDPSKGLERVWSRLDERYGSPELIEMTVKEKLSKFQRIGNTDQKKLYELSDILAEIVAIKENPKYGTLFSYFDSSAGVNPIVSKLPGFMQNKWTDRASKYKAERRCVYPPFIEFANFINEMSIRMNDPSFNYDLSPTHRNTSLGRPRINNLVTARKTEIAYTNHDSRRYIRCPLHTQSNHSLNECRSFRTLPIEDRKALIAQNGICFKCCKEKHLARDCRLDTRCGICMMRGHPDALHVDRPSNPRSFQGANRYQSTRNMNAPTGRENQQSRSKPLESQGGERVSGATSQIRQDATQVNASCTQICGPGFSGKSCAKTVLVNVFPTNHPEKNIRIYAVLDDQSNRTLVKSQFFDIFKICGQEIEYTLSSCAGNSVVSGRRADGFTIQSLDGSSSLELPTLIECNQIPNIREEIPTPSIAQHYDHLRCLSNSIHPLDENAPILMLIGRDLGEAHQIIDQIIGPRGTPFAQKLALGWVIIGETCLGKVHMTDFVNVNKTFVLPNGRPSVFKPCTNDIKLEECSDIGKDVFVRTKDDEKVGQSVEDTAFLEIMKTGFVKTEEGNWSAPLPFRKERKTLPNNYQHAYNRAKNLGMNLQNNKRKMEHFCQFMEKIFEKGHAERAPQLPPGKECWYLPIFGVYHPKKPDKIRVVFDSSAQFQGVCLNDVLLKGPDLTNNLVGVLLRFRMEKIAITGDIEQMFFNFLVHEHHRDYRFIWYEDNNPTKQLVEYRMRVHVFGNSPSPAVATLGLRKSACDKDNHASCGAVCKFVQTNFYVDDGLVSLPSEEEAVQLMKDAQRKLKDGGNLRIHKLTSNNKQVLKMFEKDDVKSAEPNETETGVDLNKDNIERSLGLSWSTISDTFTFDVWDRKTPTTKRGMLSVINSVFDPLGFVAPVILGGRIIFRNALSRNIGWDDPLPENFTSEWNTWQSSLKQLQEIHVPRAFSRTSFSEAKRIELHVFSDASQEAIGSVAYVKTFDTLGNSDFGFVMGKSKLAPRHGHTIPRLELCASVLSVITDQLSNVHIDSTTYYSDSKVVLGYINNQTRRFYVYVTNRVDKIRKLSSPEQWKYISTTANPADHATRPLTPRNLTGWLNGPSRQLETTALSKSDNFTLINPDSDKEVRPIVTSSKTVVTNNTLGTKRFSRFSSWVRLVKAIMFLRTYIKRRQGTLSDLSKVDLYKDCERHILKEVQQEWYQNEITSLRNKQKLSRHSPLISFSPMIDENGLLRIGGRLRCSLLSTDEKYPIIIPGKHHISALLIRHYHDKTNHQGRHFTEGSLRSAGYWITGAKRLISSILHHCVTCKKLRGKTEHQRMSDLPTDRVTPSPPFSYVGVDAFGPWTISTRRTRGGVMNSKRWAIIFACLTSRGIHIEVVEDMSASSFINALRRFVSLRGPVTEIRSDRGTNFVGAAEELSVNVVNVEDKSVDQFLLNNGITWKFNAPHASHMSGSWERMIGIARRILNGMLLKETRLTHEILCTLMAEVCAIVNGRPIVALSSDPDAPSILSPSTLMTQKFNHKTELCENIDIRDMYKNQWKYVQFLSDNFWKQWSQQYLLNLQLRSKWCDEKNNLKIDDIVLMKDKDLRRMQWSVGRIEDVYPSEDNRVRKVSVRMMKDGYSRTYTRPITELVYLLSP